MNNCETQFTLFAAEFIKDPQFEKLSDKAKEVFLKCARISFHAGWIASAVELYKAGGSKFSEEFLLATKKLRECAAWAYDHEILSRYVDGPEQEKKLGNAIKEIDKFINGGER